MIKLVLKDFMLMKKITLLGIIYTFVITAASLKTEPEIGNVMYCFLIICMTYVSVLYADGYDETNKGYLILASLPLKRHLLVAAKYLSLGAYYMIYAIVPVVIMAVASIIQGQGLMLYSPYAALGSFVFIGILYSIYYPVYYKFGYSALKIYKIIVFLFIVMTPKLFVYAVKLPFVSSVNNYIIFAVLTVSALIIISYMISVSIYEKKELI